MVLLINDEGFANVWPNNFTIISSPKICQMAYNNSQWDIACQQKQKILGATQPKFAFLLIDFSVLLYFRNGWDETIMKLFPVSHS